MPRFCEHAVRLGSGGAVGALGDELHLELLGDVGGDLAAQRGGDEDVGLDLPEVLLLDLLRAGEARDRLRFEVLRDR